MAINTSNNKVRIISTTVSGLTTNSKFSDIKSPALVVNTSEGGVFYADGTGGISLKQLAALPSHTHSGYATTAQLANYLPKTGGQLATTASTILSLNNTNSTNNEVGLRLDMKGAAKGWVGYAANTGTHLYTYAGPHKLGIKDDGTGFIDGNTIIHSGNIGSQSVASANTLKYVTVNDLTNVTQCTFFKGTFNAANMPSTAENYITGITLATDANPQYRLILGLDYHGKVFTRAEQSGVWQGWHQLARTSDIPTKVSQLTNDSGYTTATGHAHSNYYDASRSRTKNTVLAAPNGADGGATFRTLVAADLPTVPVSKGGTGATSLTSGAALIGNGTSAVTTRSIKNMTTKGPISDYSTALMTTNTLAYWNGSYSTSGSSNLTYCNRGAFGTIVTKNTGDYAKAGHTHDYVPIKYVTFTPANVAIGPADVLSKLGSGYALGKGTWNYDGNGYISKDTTGSIAIDLAGCSVIQLGGSSAYTQLYITAPASTTTNSKTNEILFYNNHGSGYAPAWTRVLTNRNYSEYCASVGHTHTGYSTTDTKNTAGSSNKKTKIFVVGAASQSSTGVTTYSDVSVYITNGKLYASNFITSSDERIKTNIKEVKNSVDSLGLRFVEFDYKDSSNHSAGHIAQEVKEVLPEFVHEDTTNEEHMLSIDYTGLHSVQIKALLDRIIKLEEEIKILKSSK